MAAAGTKTPAPAGMFVPLHLMSKCVGSKLVCLLDDGTEAEGTLAAHDSTCSVVLKDATAFRVTKTAPAEPGGFMSVERTPTGRFSTLVVNSRRIHALVPGGLPQA